MPFIILALLFLGAILSIVGGLWGLVLAFSDHFLWGLAYLLVPFASLAFFIMRWGRKSVRQAFWLWLSGFGMVLLSLLLSALIGQSLPSPTSSGFGDDLSQLPEGTVPEAATGQPSAALEPSGVLRPQNGE
ncbi:hypothetical protein HPC62_21650 [Thermoleptolyngbya sichuanensis A183]|uniref:Uncharacterized protein n=1 Tax=Thermoleptolyngbya sichuanensis A183 TaxID=2737172 RepID=A0A6M8BE60_9CYAN|nr:MULTISPECIES: hypothetical protein [Thermoleptolyngbya]QKD84442.1 hypothetical protein HPC62_21650 [Thermoleptolyngbya sichuanensis A183]